MTTPALSFPLSLLTFRYNMTLVSEPIIADIKLIFQTVLPDETLFTTQDAKSVNSGCPGGRDTPNSLATAEISPLSVLAMSGYMVST